MWQKTRMLSSPIFMLVCTYVIARALLFHILVSQKNYHAIFFFVAASRISRRQSNFHQKINCFKKCYVLYSTVHITHLKATKVGTCSGSNSGPDFTNARSTSYVLKVFRCHTVALNLSSSTIKLQTVDHATILQQFYEF